MESYLAWILIFLATYSKLNVVFSSKLVFEKVYFHGLISIHVSASNETFVFQTLTEISIQMCIHECKRLRICDFINFNVRKHQCIMIRSNNSGNVQVVSTPGYAYSVKADWNWDEVVRGCSWCTDKERCEFETNPVGCNTRACGTPPSIPDTVMHGNMFNTGDGIHYQCNDSSAISNGISRSTCQNNGLWSNVNITCTYEPSCTPIYPATFTETVLSDNTRFVYLITTSNFKHSAALEYCLDRCGRLVEVLTSPKFNFLKGFLTSNDAYDNTDYYIDGKYDSSTGKFVTTSGIELQHNNHMWESNPAYFGSSQACIRLREGAQYKINTHSCNTKYGVICEQP